MYHLFILCYFRSDVDVTSAEFTLAYCFFFSRDGISSTEISRNRSLARLWLEALHAEQFFRSDRQMRVLRTGCVISSREVLIGANGLAKDPLSSQNDKVQH